MPIFRDGRFFFLKLGHFISEHLEHKNLHWNEMLKFFVNTKNKNFKKNLSSPSNKTLSRIISPHRDFPIGIAVHSN